MFILVDSNVFALPGTSRRYFHLATVHMGLREFICFLDALTQQCYVEEITGGQLNFIEEEELATDLTRFLEEKGITDLRTTGEKIGSL